MKFAGELLKEKRIRKNLELDTVKKELKISMSYLTAIENDDFSIVAGNVYDIGFVRTYSKYLNLNSDEIVDLYKKQISFSNLPEPIELPKPAEAFSPFISFKLISFFGIIFISGVFYFTFIDNSNLVNEYAITSELPLELEAEVEKYELQTTLANINDVKKDIVNNQKNLLEEKLLTKVPDEIFNKNQVDVIASIKTEQSNEDIKNIISLKVLNSTWIHLRNNKKEIIISKLMNKNDEYSYLLTDNYTLTTGNAGNIIVSIGGVVIGKLGKKGEVLDSIKVSSDYFLNH